MKGSNHGSGLTTRTLQNNGPFKHVSKQLNMDKAAGQTTRIDEEDNIRKGDRNGITHTTMESIQNNRLQPM
tara:strand:- start:206 stop:418 length:213 start_codon:yes stop_codon:yes gene_type:complete